MSYLHLMSILFLFYLKSLSVKGDPPAMQNIKKDKFECEGGTLLSVSVCVPKGYLKGEVPKEPTIVNTKIEINNIREINDKRMRITLDYYQELKWTDNRIITSFSGRNSVVLNNNLINDIWKPDLWIKNLFDFKLHSVLEPTTGLVITASKYCDFNNCTEGQIKRNTIVAYNLEAQQQYIVISNF